MFYCMFYFTCNRFFRHKMAGIHRAMVTLVSRRSLEVEGRRSRIVRLRGSSHNVVTAASTAEQLGKAARQTRAELATLACDPQKETPQGAGFDPRTPRIRRLHPTGRAVSGRPGHVDLGGIQQDFDGIRVFCLGGSVLEANSHFRRPRRRNVFYIVYQGHTHTNATILLLLLLLLLLPLLLVPREAVRGIIGCLLVSDPVKSFRHCCSTGKCGLFPKHVRSLPPKEYLVQSFFV